MINFCLNAQLEFVLVLELKKPKPPQKLTVVGESSLDRIARSLGGQTVLKAIAPKIAELLNPASSWQDKRAALLALSAIAEGTAKSIKSILPELVPAMLPFLQVSALESGFVFWKIYLSAKI